MASSPFGHLSGTPAPRRASDVARAAVKVCTAQGFTPSEYPDSFSAEPKGRSLRLHRQFWCALRLAQTDLISRTADNRWELRLHFGFEPSSQRNDPDHGQFEIADALEDLIVAWDQDPTLRKDEILIASGDPVWVEDHKFWDVEVVLGFRAPRRTA